MILRKCDRICWVCGWRSPFSFLESALAQLNEVIAFVGFTGESALAQLNVRAASRREVIA
ncbi:MAG: hypothetical protein V7K69_20120 [Nostoc sp.]|uniref:hypothetical protein n=1 Tax=Nostoc sp. TaxID=1180 RepID=UPI002FF67A88